MSFTLDMNTYFLKKRKIATHIIGWIGYFLFWFMQYKVVNNDHIILFKYTLLQMLFHMVLVYVNNYFFIPQYLYRQRIALYIAAYLSSSFAIGAGNFFLSYSLFGNVGFLFETTTTTYDGLTACTLLSIFVTSLPAWYKVNSDKLKSDSDAKQLMNDKINEELKFLKAQINPHFLFNSLNTVFNLIDSNKEEARKTLVQFSEILRFQLYETGNDTISLIKEMDYIRNYAAIEKARKGDAIEIIISENTKFGIELPPLLLLTFVENAFKHVSNLDKGNYIIIEAKTQQNIFEFCIRNSIGNYQPSFQQNQNSGIGLKNIRRRLNLLYPERHDLQITENEHSFEVHLKLYNNEKN